MSVPQPVKRYTPQEYYRLERQATYKSDYYKGEIFNMSGGTARHSLISLNVAGEMRSLLKGKPCTAYESNLRLRILTTGLRTYPDASVYCGPLEFDPEDDGVETATNPTVLFEVLSKTTEAYDRGLKSISYRQIQTLRAYLLIAQAMPHVEVYARQPDGSWTLHEETALAASVTIPGTGVRLPLAEIYAGVQFGEEAEDARS